MWKAHLQDMLRYGHMGYRLYVAKQSRFDPVKVELLVQPTIKTVDQHSFFKEEDAFLDDTRMPESNVRGFLQAMSDAAWELGIKPKQLEDHINELKATKFHLEDMRLLAGVKK